MKHISISLHLVGYIDLVIFTNQEEITQSCRTRSINIRMQDNKAMPKTLTHDDEKVQSLKASE